MFVEEVEPVVETRIVEKYLFREKFILFHKKYARNCSFIILFIFHNCQ